MPAQRTLFELPIGPAVALFLFMSAVAHFLLAWPLRGWYERRLAAGIQPMRWLEYSLSSSVMIVVIAALAGIQEIGTLVAIFGVNAAMNLFGWSMELGQPGPRQDAVEPLRLRLRRRHRAVDRHQHRPLVSGHRARRGAQSRASCGPSSCRSSSRSTSSPSRWSSSTGEIGRWRDYLVGEKTYMFMSLFAKTILAWQVFFGTLAP